MALNRSYLAAKKVEIEVEGLIQESPTYVGSSPWRIEREKGFRFDATLLDGRDMFVYVCEHANSDDIRVIPSASYRAEDIAEHEWDSALLYGPREVSRAADKVVELLEAEIP